MTSTAFDGRGIVKVELDVPTWSNPLTVLATHETGGRFETNYIVANGGWGGAAAIRESAEQQIKDFAGTDCNRVIVGDFNHELKVSFETSYWRKSTCDPLAISERTNCFRYGTRPDTLGDMSAMLNSLEFPATQKSGVHFDDFYMSVGLRAEGTRVLDLMLPAQPFLQQMDERGEPLPDHQPIVINVTPT